LDAAPDAMVCVHAGGRVILVNARTGRLFGYLQQELSEYPGSGVGLASVRQIVERHGGQVWAEGVLDAGAAFTLRFRWVRSRHLV
jgi:chemotaxis family two-component system sensor kinase Cph1